MHLQKNTLLRLTIFFSFLLLFYCTKAQMITGVWHGKIDNQKVEVKMIQSGDSITGTSYYYESASQYRRYIIKGYFDETDNSVVWWDDQLIEDRTKGLNLFSRKKRGASKADFNCPGPGVMMLDGKMYAEENQKKPQGDVHLDKTETTLFKDEWDFIIKNYTVGANDPDIIDSVSLIAKQSTGIEKPVETIEEKPKTILSPVVKNEEAVRNDSSRVKNEIVNVSVTKQETKIETKIAPPTIEQKFVSREKVFTKEIPITVDSIELRFYDNAEIDGDSISLFLNGKLIFEHIRLTEKAYVVKLGTSELTESNELIMVAENLGAIPPNTSYMIAVVGDKRYDAQLASTENSSAMIRLVKKKLEEENKKQEGQ
jgi:hypothetical protein